MTDLKWVSCPKCNECSDLHRIGEVGNLYVRNKQGKMGVRQSRRVKCGFCGTIFFTDDVTMLESMGKDTVGETSF